MPANGRRDLILRLKVKQNLSTAFVEDKNFALSEVRTDIIDMDVNALRLVFTRNTYVIILQNSTVGTKE